MGQRAHRSVAGALGVGALAAWPFVEPHLPVLRRVAVPVLEPGQPPITVLHLSDLHLLPRHRRRAGWVRDLRRERPDLVVSTGDHWSSELAGPLLVETLGALTAGGTPGVVVPGNNDPFSPKRPALLGYLREGARVRRPPDLPWAPVVEQLVGAGWTDLTQRRTVLTLAGRPVTLTGTDDAHLTRDRYAEVAGAVPAGLAIGVTHTPARRLLQAFARDGHQLILAGHTHGGQLRVPFVGPMTTNCDLPRWRARGLTLDAGTYLHVSAGLGQSPYVPIRVACRPEATLLTLTQAASEPASSGGPGEVR